MLTLLLLGQAPTAEAVLNRFDQYIKRADTLSVAIKAKVNGQSLGNGYLKLDRPSRLRLSVTFKGSELAFILNEKEGLEIDRRQQAYAEVPSLGRLGIPPMKFSELLNYIAPSPLVYGSSQSMFPSKSQPTVTPKVMVNGVPTDQLSLKQSTPMGDTEVKYWIDATGRLVKFYSRSSGAQGTMLIEHDYSNYVINQKIKDADFSTQLPLGYSPYALPSADYGVQQGESVPNIQVRNAGSGRDANLSSLISGSNAVVLVTDPDFHANAGLLASLQNVLKKIPDSRLVVIGMRRDAVSTKRIGAKAAYFDPTGTQLTKLAIPGAPTIYLVDKKGKLAQMFFGFDGLWDGLDKAIERLK